MIFDAHCHPADLLKRFPQAEAERRAGGVSCFASAWNEADFTLNETLSREALRDKAPEMRLCFAVHPQLPAQAPPSRLRALIDFMESLADSRRLDGIGEAGFDLYDERFRRTEAAQDELFALHLDLALRKGLPLVIHARKAMHKVFSHAKALKKLRAVIFHAYSGTLGEAESLLRRGINGYFSFGNHLVQGRKETRRCCACLPLDRLLAETDSPYQNLPGAAFSHWGDLPAVLKAMAALRPACTAGGCASPRFESVSGAAQAAPCGGFTCFLR
jgi:TatD DNase family protein